MFMDFRVQSLITLYFANEKNVWTEFWVPWKGLRKTLYGLVIEFTLLDRNNCSVCQSFGLRIVCHLLMTNHSKKQTSLALPYQIMFTWQWKYLEEATWAFPKRTPRAATDAAMSCAMFSELYDVIGLPARRQSASLKYDTTAHASSTASLSMKSRTAKHQMSNIS